MKLLSDDQEEKDDYYKSFETDSFDLEDCFNGSTQPQNSSLLSNRMRERTLPAPSVKKDNQYLLGKILPTPTLDDIRKSTSSPMNLSTPTPLKPPGFQVPLSSFLSNAQDPTKDITNDVIKSTIKNALRELLANEPLG